MTEKLKLYKVPINRRPGVPPLATLKTLLPNMEESKLLALDEAALLAALGISTKEKVAKTCYIGPPIIETNATADAADTAAADSADPAAASDGEVGKKLVVLLFKKSHSIRHQEPEEGDMPEMTCWHLIGQITRCCPMIG